jgi:hypothetical protein
MLNICLLKILDKNNPTPAIDALMKVGLSNVEAQDAVVELSGSFLSLVAVRTEDIWPVDLSEFFVFEFIQRVEITLETALFPKEKIHGIQAIRAATGMGLVDSKDTIENLFMGVHTKIQSKPEEVENLRKWFTLTAEELGPVPQPYVPGRVVQKNTISHCVGSSHKEEAMEHMSAFAKELLDEKKWEAAQNICNLLSILKTVEEYQ